MFTKKSKSFFAITLISLFLCSCLTVNPLNSTQSDGNKSNPIESYDFSFDKTNSTLPEDVLREVTFSATGGGCFCDFPSTSERPNSRCLEQKYYINSKNYILTCDWQENEKVNVILVKPNGDIESQDVFARNSMISFPFILDFNSQPGEYKFQFSGEKYEVEILATVEQPDFPTMYTHNDKIYLYNFRPNENITVYAYSHQTNKMVFEGYMRFQAEKDGTLVVNLPSTKNFDYFVIGDDSGEMPQYMKRPISMPTCDGALESRMRSSQLYFRVLNGDLREASVFSFPGFDQDIEYNFSSGAEREIIGGPVCEDNTFWWEVRYSGGFGWIAESYKDKYLIEPVTIEKTNTSFVCPNTPQSRVNINDEAQVTYNNGLYLRVRKFPGTSEGILLQIAEGEKFKVIDGPECESGYVWWKINLDDGTIGWVAEGDKTNYFIEPLH